MITQTRLKELLNYNPRTGEFTWLQTRSHNAKVGEQAGYINTHGYRTLTIDDTKHRSARIAVLYMTGRFPKEQVDHINRNPLDDSWDNLREASQVENQCNKSTNNLVIGVCPDNRTKNTWRAYGTAVKGKQEHLGTYNKYSDAICARKSWEAANE